MNNIVIIGNGCAGYNAAKAIRDKDKTSNVILISEEKLITYYRPLLSEYLNNEPKENVFYLSKEQWYKENNIDLKLGITVQNIDTSAKKVYLNDSYIDYDKLILANGSSNIIPTIKGYDKKGVFTLKDLEDLNNIKSWMKDSKKVAVIGGGLLGLEAAFQMKLYGLEVIVIEAASHLMNKQLDAEASQILKESFEESGIEVYTSTMLEEIKGMNKVSSIKLSKNIILDVDMVLFSIGIKPNINLLKNTDISVNRGVIVNDKMETNIPNVYACGDICEFHGRVYGNWPASILMGKVAGLNSIDEDVKFEGYRDAINFTGVNLKVFSIGNIFYNDTISMQFLDKSKRIYKKIFFKDNILVGAILIGDISSGMKLLKGLNKITLEEFLKEYKEYV